MKRLLIGLLLLLPGAAFAQTYPWANMANYWGRPDGGPPIALVNFNDPQTESTFLRGPNPGGGTAPPVFGPLVNGDFNNVIPMGLLGGLALRVHGVTADTTLSSTYGVVDCSTGSGNVNLTLPAATGSSLAITVFKSSSDANTCTVTRAGSDTIQVATSIVLTQQWEWVELTDRATASWSLKRGLGYVNLTALPITPIGPAVGVNVGAVNFSGGGNHSFEAWKDVAGNLFAVQESLYFNNVSGCVPTDAGTLGFFGNMRCSVLDTSTVTHPTPTSTSKYTRMQRSVFTNVTGAGRSAGWGQTNGGTANYWVRGNAAGYGGFFYYSRFAIDTWTAGDRLFVGLSSGSTMTPNLDPSGRAYHMIGLAMDAADSVITLLTKEAVTAKKTTVTGINAPASGVMLDFYMYCKPNDTLIYYRVDDANAGTVIFDGSIDCSNAANKCPTNTVYMAPWGFMDSGANAGASAAVFANVRTMLSQPLSTE